MVAEDKGDAKPIDAQGGVVHIAGKSEVADSPSLVKAIETCIDENKSGVLSSRFRLQANCLQGTRDGRLELSDRSQEGPEVGMCSGRTWIGLRPQQIGRASG